MVVQDAYRLDTTKIAVKRHKVMEQFLDKFFKEWEDVF